MIAENWNATEAERAAHMPCDDIVDDGTRLDRAISIDAPPSTVFAWLCQLRVAPYSYDLLDNTGRRSPRTRTPELTDLAVGQPFVRIFGHVHVFELVSYTADEHITLRQRDFGPVVRVARVGNTYKVRPEGDGTRLHVRVVFEGPWLFGQALAVVNLLMMRKQLRTLKSLAERDTLIAP